MEPHYSQEDFLLVLTESRLFKKYPEEQLRRLVTYAREVSFSAGDEIIRQGQTNEEIYILLSGVIQVFAEGEYILRLRRKGDLVGEIGFLTRKTASAAVSAYTDSKMFSLSAAGIEKSNHDDLKEMLQQVFLEILTQKLALTTNMVKGFQVASEELILTKQELAKSEGNLCQNEAILRQVLSSMSDGVVIIDEDGRLTQSNAAFKELVGYRQIPEDIHTWPECLGLYQPDEITPYDAKELLKFIKNQRTTGNTDEIFVKNEIIQDGVWLQASGDSLQYTEDSLTKGSVIVFRDFTKNKADEKALIKARDQAKSEAKAKSDFLSAMSHELRTPLNSILGIADLMPLKTLDDEQLDCIDTIKDSSENLLRLIQNVLDYSNLESKNILPEYKNVNTREYLETVTKSCEAKAGKKGLDFSISINPDVPETISTYPNGLSQILTNLLHNAVKFTETGSVNLALEIRNNPQSQELVFAVKDTGVGISEEKQDDLFKAFINLDLTYSRQFEGAGIALNICEKYAQLMKGRIWVDSELEKGSIFYLGLRDFRATGIDEEKPAQHIKPLYANKDFAKALPLSILIVDDNDLNLSLAKKILQLLGYEAKLANNGAKAVQACLAEKFDVVFMDLHMPEMDGFEASQAIHRNCQDEAPSIIALTASVSDAVREQCLTAGMKGYLTKPIKRDQLVQILHQITKSNK